MKYALLLDDTGRILSSTYAQYAHDGAVLVEELPEGDIPDYRYENNEFIYDPVPRSEQLDTTPTPQDDIDAMLVDHEYRLTLLELGLV